MGTNYYWIEQLSEPCPHCGRFDPGEELHIGKSSGGWCFTLHVMPDEGINTLADWKRLWSERKGIIRDEYGEEFTIDRMMKRITDRSGNGGKSWNDKDWGWLGYHSEQEFLDKNHAVPGPRGLLRHSIDGVHCVGHGEGTWDYIRGEFS